MSLKEGTANIAFTCTNLLCHLIIWPLLTFFFYRLNSSRQKEQGKRSLVETTSISKAVNPDLTIK